MTFNFTAEETRQIQDFYNAYHAPSMSHQNSQQTVTQSHTPMYANNQIWDIVAELDSIKAEESHHEAGELASPPVDTVNTHYLSPRHHVPLIPV